MQYLIVIILSKFFKNPPMEISKEKMSKKRKINLKTLTIYVMIIA